MGKTWSQLELKRGELSGAGVFSANELVISGWTGIQRSDDGGKTWEPFASFDDKTQKSRGGMTGGALEPGDGKTVLARGYNYQVKNLFYSADLGKTWTPPAKTREGVMGWGVFGPRDLVISYWNHIERSEDAGATWTEVAKFGFCAGPVVHLGGAAYWLSKQGMTVSRDSGRTWAVQGAAPPSPIRSEVWTGLLPGKDENHFVFLSKQGPMETLDGGKSWSLVARMPEGFAKTHLGISLGYDAAHDVFYMIAGGHGGLRPVKYARQWASGAGGRGPRGGASRSGGAGVGGDAVVMLPPSVRIFVAAGPADLRRSFDGLAAMARDVVRQDPLSGHLFVFSNRRRAPRAGEWSG